MANHNIYLTLEGENLKWSPDGLNGWKDVTPTSPLTTVKRLEEVDWISNDDTISKIKVKFNKTDIFKNIKDNDSKKPKATVEQTAQANAKDKYEIWVKKGDGTGGYLKFDPEVKVGSPPDQP